MALTSHDDSMCVIEGVKDMKLYRSCIDIALLFIVYLGFVSVDR
jgi:hypothetical protein